MALDIFPYQQIGAEFLAGRERAGLHDEMGVGKTAQVIRAINHAGIGRGVIVAPAMLRENWLGEFKKFSTYPLRVCKGRTIHDFVAWSRGRFDVLVTSYELAVKWLPHFMEQGEFIDFLAMDEAHYLKNMNTTRTKALLGPDASMAECFSSWASRVWHVTGTPIPNDPVDIYPFLRMAGCMPLDFNAFKRRYFSSKPTAFGSRQEMLPEMAAELHSLIANNAIRRTKKDIGVQLPSIFLTSFLVDGDTEQVRTLIAQYPGLERSILNAVESGGLSFLDAQHVATLRRLIGEAKAVPYAHMLLDELMFSGEKRAVYGIHTSALLLVRNFLVRNGIDARLVYGATPEHERVEAVRAFQQDPNCKVFIGNIRAAGTGLTLTAACEIDLLESDWTPAGNAQAIMRVHRLGQTRNVRARFITLASSFDVQVVEIVRRKTAAIAQIEGDAMVAAPS